KAQGTDEHVRAAPRQGSVERALLRRKRENPVDHLVHGPVTAEADHQVIALFSGPLHQFPRMAPILRQHRVHRHVAGERTDNDVARAGGSRCGLRIPDEQRAHAASLLTLPSSTVVDRRPVLRAEGPAEQGTKEAGYSEAVSRRPITLLLAAVCEGLLGVLLFILGGYVLVNTL